MREDFLRVTGEIADAVRGGKAVVALESTILSHGMPYPENRAFAARVEKIIRGEGAVPATCAVLGGKLRVGLSEDELEILCRGDGVAKVSRRDLAVCLATGRPGATTVASTMICAAMAGIRFFATGGIGGVHRRGEVTMDVSADLQELARTPVGVICAGAKSVLDIGRTLEYLETMGVPVLGYRTDDFPAFYCRRSGFGVDYRVSGPDEAARVARTKWDLGLDGGLVFANPIPEEFELDSDEMEAVIREAVEAADREGIRGKRITPYLLDRIKSRTGGRSFASNLELAYNNARVASRIAVAYSKL